jgi:predicted HicB family RNase H-like nuclease
MATSFTAFYDANVLYRSELRNLLMRLAMTGLFRARWSEGVHKEACVIDAARQHRESLKNPAKTASEYIEMLRREGLTETAAILRTCTIEGAAL